jgi:serine/threonine protein kinase
MSLAPPEPSQLAPGYKLDRYELICPIAEGGMASVWIGRQTGKHGFQKLVAIKTILPKFAADPRFQQMFVDEARIASRIEHANVTQILDVGEQHDVTYLVMEYIDGDALSKLNRAAKKKGGAIPPGVVLRVMADVCGGLHAAHELLGADGQTMGVVHRDVSPQNVLVSTKGVAKLIDFGIAKARDRLAGDTNAETLKGKVQYMAPEQALGRPVDRRADVWAVGAVLYHLLSGKPPFEAENEIQTLFVLSSGRPPPPMRSAHPAVAAVVRRALSHVREQRFATAAEMQQALEEAIVQAGLVTTTAAVAAYLAEQVGDRANKRKEAIALGLKAAEEREKFAEQMRNNTDLKQTGISDTGMRTATHTPAGTPASEATNPSSATGQTLGSAAVAVTPRDGGRGLRFAIVGGVVGASVAVLALVLLLGPGRSKPSAAAQGPGTPVASAVTPPAPTAPAAPVTTTPVVPEPPASDTASAPAASASASTTASTARPAPAIVARPVRTATGATTPTTGAAPTRVNDGF